MPGNKKIGWTLSIICILITIVPELIDPMLMPLANLIMYPVWMAYEIGDASLQFEGSIAAGIAQSADEYIKSAEALETVVKG